MNMQRMKKSAAPAILIVTALIFMSGCASWNKAYHKYIMRGTILETSGNEVYLCIGSRDGAQVGQKFDVYKLTTQGTYQPGKGGVVGPTFRKDKTGTIKITQIVNEHFARATVTSGTAKKDYVAELEFPVECDCNKGK